MSILKNRSGVFQHFLDRGVAGKDAAQAILAQRDHAELDRFLFQNNGRRAFVNQLAQRIREDAPPGTVVISEGTQLTVSEGSGGNPFAYLGGLGG